ncbi:MAG TPA: DUF1385 domain-containing protein [Clostridiales bacterium]|nr:DUF1385 domain-containing protein [Clostridiales bacterium]
MRKTKIGGQAVLEGVMMKGSHNIAIAVRRPDGQIIVKSKDIKPPEQRHWFLKLPVVRGVVAFFESMVLGITSLTISAELYGEEDHDYQPSKFEHFLATKFNLDAQDVMIFMAVVIAIGLAILMFVVAPTSLTSFLGKRLPATGYLSVIEGLIRLGIFLLYITAVSRLGDIKRIFQYHGAEHKVIHCFEHEQPLTVDNARRYQTLHPRCGTNFLLIVMVISIFVFTFLGWDDIIRRIISRVALLPVVAGLSYEVIRWAGSSDSRLVKIISYPGLMLQKLTTKQPDDSQLEVAIAAFNNVLIGGEGGVDETQAQDAESH